MKITPGGVVVERLRTTEREVKPNQWSMG